MSWLAAARTAARRALAAARAARPYHLRLRPWEPLPPAPGAPPARCTVCRWEGPAFLGIAHSESAVCPRCRSIARDRYLAHCLVARTRYRPGLRVLETSPRLGRAYRRAMARRVDYLASDFDGRAHRASLRLDLQRIALPDAHVDVILTPHVLEHVPDTDAALRELFRVLRPGGRMFLQVPLLQARTAPPAVPEFHGDDTPVHWRFGLDLTDRLRAAGFDAVLLVTEDFRRRVEARDGHWAEPVHAEWDAAALVEAARAEDLVAVADDRLAAAAGFAPSYMHATWEAVRPA